MRLRELHPWDLSPSQAMALQARLASQVIAQGEPREVRYVAGCDIALGDSSGRGAVVLLSYPDLRPVEHHVVDEPVAFPYIPGLLAFREVPVLARAFQRLERTPDLLLVDGHGLSHPRRFGIACHLGLLLDVPTIGVAKSRLVGEHGLPADEPGAQAELRDGAEVIGLVMRTRQGVSPVYISVGHRIGLAAAADWALRLCRLGPDGRPAYRLPEPVRLADHLSKGRPLQVPSTKAGGEQMSLF